MGAPAAVLDTGAMLTALQASSSRVHGRLPAGLLALAVHVAFFVLLVVGVNWQARRQPPVSVELWSAMPAADADTRQSRSSTQRANAKREPRVPPHRTEPKTPPRSRAEAKPAVAEREPEPAPMPKTPVAEPPGRAQADIDLRARLDRELRAGTARQEEEKRRAEEKRLAEEDRQAEEAIRKDEQRRAEADEAHRQEEQRKQDEARRQEEQRRQEDARRQDELRKIAEQRRADDLARSRAIDQERSATAQAEQAQNQRLLDGYKKQVHDWIKKNTTPPAEVASGARVEIRLNVLTANGEVLPDSVVVVRSSGNKLYDDAVVNGILKASPLPMPKEMDLRQQFRDLTLAFTHEK